MEKKELLEILKVAWDDKGNFQMWRVLHSPEFLKGNFLYEIAKQIEDKFPNHDSIVGVGRKGGILGAHVSLILKKPCLSCSPYSVLPIFEIKHFKKQMTEFTGQEVLIVDDTTHTGESYQKAKRILTDCGLRVLGGFVLVWMDLNGHKAPIPEIQYLFAQSEIPHS